ncbi:MAG: DUF2298 domain-containing protein [Vampirovibrionia bacterium]
MLYQILDVFKWYFAIQILSVIGFILGYNLLSSLKFHGFSISKSFGIFIIGLITWFICNEKLTILPYTSQTLYVIILILCGFTIYTYLQNKEEINKFITTNYKYLISIEIAFLIFFLIFVLLRTYTPNIEGTEKPLEFVVINSILNGQYFPQQDCWLAGEKLNYYYFGQYLFSNITKLSLIKSSIAFNLINPTILALIIISSFEFIYELTNKIKWGILAAFMTGLMGNLEPITEIIKYGWKSESFSWWASGHIIPNSFPEFPYWSYLHSDVHAHFLVHPFTILFLFLLLAYIKDKTLLITIENFKNKEKITKNLLLCALVGSFMLTNSWNYPCAIALLLAALFIHCYTNMEKTSLIVNIIRIFPPIIFYTICSYIIYLAFYAYYSSPIEGIGLVNPENRTTLEQFILLTGTFLLPIILYILIDSFIYVIKDKNKSLTAKILILAGIIAIPSLVYFLTKSIVLLITIFIWEYFLIKLLRRSLNTDTSIIYSIAFLIFSLIITCEFIYINDMFGESFERQNTVAKSYIQLLLLLPIITSYIMYMISEKIQLNRYIKYTYISTMTILIIASSIFLIIGTSVKNDDFKHIYKTYNWHIPTLDGSYYIKEKYGSEYEGIIWLINNANNKDIVLEAEGKPYSHFGRVASHSGIPSLINWSGSLNVLRGKYFYLISTPRIESIKKIFSTTNKDDIKQELINNKISYIFIGSLERSMFTPEELSGFETNKKMFEKVFEKGNTTIYKVK